MASPSPRRASMADVAAAAGVSSQTVSRVVNDSPRVDPATRARVEAAMEGLGYRMHRAARALRTGRTDTIGLIVSTLASVGNSRMLQALADAAAGHGLALTVVTAAGREAVAEAFARLRDRRRCLGDGENRAGVHGGVSWCDEAFGQFGGLARTPKRSSARGFARI